MGLLHAKGWLLYLGYLLATLQGGDCFIDILHDTRMLYADESARGHRVRGRSSASGGIPIHHGIHVASRSRGIR